MFSGKWLHKYTVAYLGGYIYSLMHKTSIIVTANILSCISAVNSIF